jgi:predicted Zn-dependent peptidase
LGPQKTITSKETKKSASMTSKDQGSLKLTIESDEKTQAHIILGFESFPISDERLPAFLIANHILGSTMSSRLFTEIREVRGLAYTTYSTNSSLRNTGYTFLYAGVQPNGVLETLSVFNNELEKISNVKVPKDEFDQNRSHILGQIRLSHESTSFSANWLAIQRIRRGTLTAPQDIMQQIQNVSQDDILNASQKIFHNPKRNIVIVGAVDPKFQLPNDFEYYRRRGNST